ncbi:MAG: 3-dehydroquinate synthase [Pyrinomonadaceae bacterium]
MKEITLKVGTSTPDSAYSIRIGSELIVDSGKWARRCLGKDAKRIVLVSNPRVFRLYGPQAIESLWAAGFTVSHFLMRDGEVYKNFRSAESVLRACSEAGLSRTDAVVALGGGVVGDLAGFAAAIYLRGIRFLQIPTTLLAMIDSSVGGKTGVNSAFGKNLIGSFHQPSGVLVDIDTLRTLHRRELTAGFCEVVKHGAIGGKALLKQTDDLLARFPVNDLSQNLADNNICAELAALIEANAAFKARIVAGDERESSSRTNATSRKILNFGHTLAHALEKVTDYKYLKHGEAVGYGIMFAAELSKSLALCDEKSVKSLNDVVHRVGTLPSLADIDEKGVVEAFRFDKKNLSGSLQMVLLKGIGKPVIVSDVPQPTVRTVLKRLLRQWA